MFWRYYYKRYFLGNDHKYYSLKKYTDRDEYKSGDKAKIIHIPDLIILDPCKSEIINIEGKTYKNRQRGILELANFNAIEELYIKIHYPSYSIQRTVIIYGSKEEKICEIQISFMLNELGKLILGVKAPDIFKKAITNLFTYWEPV